MNRTLRIFGKLTLSILLLTTTSCELFDWDFGALAFDRFPKETALDKSYKFEGKVIIIGAGASGLAAATILEKNGVDYEIIEASNRYGGRLMKVEGFADFPIDIGAEWIHNMPQVLNRLKGIRDDEIREELIPYQLVSSASWDGENYVEIPKKDLDEYFAGFPEYKFKRKTWYDFVDEHFAQKVKHRIRYNSPVVEIDYSGKQVSLKLGSGESIIADKVLVTVSVGVLQSNAITFKPALDQKKLKAINAVKFLPGFKLVMKFHEEFYPNVISCKTKVGTKDFYDVAFKKESADNVLGLLSMGSSTEAYYKLNSEEAIVNKVLSELDQMFAGKATELYTGEYLIQDWGRHAFTQGTWSSTLMGSKQLQQLNRPVGDKVYFSGGANDTHRQQGVPGAILSGYDTIDRLLSDN
ncbi:MAG: NAD(P)/FAD-dependent oxidoreductase [Bacteroidota bacterium]